MLARVNNEGTRFDWLYDSQTQFRLRLADLKGKDVEVTIKPVGRKASGEQRGWLFGVAIPIIRAQIDNLGGVWQHLIATVDGRDIYSQYHVGLHAADRVILNVLYCLCGNVGPQAEMMTVSEMNTAEMTRFMNNVQRIANDDLDYLYIPDPDPEWRQNGEAGITDDDDGGVPVPGTDQEG